MSDAGRVKKVGAFAVSSGEKRSRDDSVAVEEPLAIRVVAEHGGRRVRHDLAVTMRTPGDDLDLAVGFLRSEGVIERSADLWKVEPCRDPEAIDPANTVDVYLKPGVPFDVERFSRHVYTSSSCGVCGKASLDQVRGVGVVPPARGFRVASDVLQRLPAALERAQPLFAQTGGIHAAALFDAAGELVQLREDVGRHNAVDKIIGALARAGELPASERLLLVSGRTSFELVQKALVGGIPLLAAVGAPSSLAIDLAREFGMSLVGFLRQDRFNVYVGEERIRAEQDGGDR